MNREFFNFAQNLGSTKASLSQKGGFFAKSDRILRSKPVMTFLLLAVMLSGFVFNGQYTQGATFTFTQTSWSGGLSGGTYPAHPGDQTGFNKYDSKDSTVTAGATVSLTSQSSSIVHTDTNFSAGSLTNASVASSVLRLSTSGNNSAWSTISPQGTPPSARAGAASVWDPVNSRFYVFGGGTNAALATNTLYSYTPSTNTWATISPSGSAPTARRYAGAAWDTVNNRMYIFGGDTSLNNSGQNNELYSYTPSTNAWATITPTGTAPTNGSRAAVLWSSNNSKLYIIGGNTTGTSNTNSVMTYTPATNAWGSPNPSSVFSSRDSSAAVWDATNNKAYYFGGMQRCCTTYLNDFYSYNSNNTWSTLTPSGTAPLEREGAGAVWDPNTNKMYIFGGIGNSSYNNLFTYTPSGNAWAAVSPSGSAPSARQYMSTVWDPATSKMYVFGGNNNSNTHFSDLYVYDAGPAYQSSGNLVSTTVDLGQASTVGNLTFTASTPTNTTLRIQLRSATTSGALSAATWYGPTGTGDYYTSTGTAINSVHNGHRYFQYRVLLDTTNSSATPTLTNLTIGYSYYPASATLTGSAYNSGDAANVLAKIQWSATTPTGTSVSFQMRTAPNSGGVPGSWSSWVGPDGTSGTYFTDATGSEATPAVLRTNSQWIQYKAFLATTDTTLSPTLSSVTLTYVVNAAPVVSSVTAVQGSDGNVTVGYNLSDAEDATATISLAADLGIVLSGTLSSGANTATVSSATYLPSAGTIFIDSEEISYTSKTSNTLNGLTRAQNNSILASHSDATKVWLKASTVSGNIGSTSMGSGKSLTWMVGSDVINFSSASVLAKVIANDGNVANQIGSSQSAAFTVDTTPPATQTTSSVRGIPTSDTTVTVVWVTDKVSRSLVEYGTTDAYGLSASDSNMVTTHAVQLTSMAPNTKYYFRVTSTDAVNNALVDDNGGDSYTVTTPNIGPGETVVVRAPADVDNEAPTISNVAVSNITASSATITWNANEESNSVVYYGQTSGYGLVAGAPDVFSGVHQVSLTGLAAGAMYHFKAVSLDKAANRGQSADMTFETTGATGGNTGNPDRAALEQRISQLQNQKSSLETQIADLNTVIEGLSDGAEKTAKLAELDTLETQYNEVVSDLASAQAALAALDGSTDVNNALQDQIDSLQSQLSGMVSGAEFDKVQAQLKAAQAALEQFNAIKAENEKLKQQVSKLQENLTYITNKILGIKDGDSLSPADLLKIVANKFNQLAQLFKGKATTAEQKVVEESLSDVNTTLKDLTELVPGPKILTSPVVEISANNVTVSWSTDKPASGLVSYADQASFDSSKSYGVKAGDATVFSTEHKVVLNNLLPSTLYHYKVTSVTEAGIETVSTDFTFTTRTELPVISAARIRRVDDISAQVDWQTTIASNSAVTYIPIFAGVPDLKSAKTQGTPELTKNHSVKLEGLLRGTTYSLEITSSDAFGNTVNQKIGNYQTSADTLAPEITQLRPEVSIIPDQNATRIQAIITWKTDKPATTQVVFSKGSVTGDKFSDITTLNEELTYGHTAVITNWEPGTLYSFKAVSKDQSGNEGRSKTFTIKTPQPKATVVDLIIDNFTDVFGWTKKLK